MGFDSAKFVTSVADDKKCLLCKGVLDNPVRAPCGHVFCSGCIMPWVVSQGACPKKCRTLTPTDLENVLSLREVILNLKVKCEFSEHGCTEAVRLTDLIRHTQRCPFRQVACSNPECDVTLSMKEMYLHESEMCPNRSVGACDKGCGLTLYLHTMDSHDCYQALKALVSSQEQQLKDVSEKLGVLTGQFNRREKSLLQQVDDLTKQLGHQQHKFNKTVKDVKAKYQLDGDNDNELHGEFSWRRITLHRDKSGSLGFNIMGGYTPENNNNNGPVGVLISRVTEGGVGEVNGLRVSDRIIKVNGQDLSQSSHNEAVEAFRSAREPIVVEVLRRTSKSNHNSTHNSSNSNSNSSSSVGVGGGGGGGGGGFGCSSGGSRGMKSRCPTMVSIGTQTEEDFYCYNRPPTPPPGFYPIPLVTGLYQPSSRRPVAFSPSADMGLTDIEMAHNLDIDDPFFDDRHYEMVYEEVILRRNTSDEKLGLTLCYGSLEDEMTDIFISEVDPCSIAGKDGRIREGDQIVQINGVDVRSRSEAISLFSGQNTDIALTVARPQLQCDDGFMEEPNVVLDDLHLDLLEKHHQDNMQFMASMLARRHLDEEGGTTDTATTENSSQKHEKDSGVGRTDESTKNDESSEQDTFDCESMISPPSSYCKGRYQALEAGLLSGEMTGDACNKFREMLDHRCSSAGNSPRRGDSTRKDSESSLERELAVLNREMEEIQVECQDLVDNHMKEQSRLAYYNESVLRGDTQRSPRIVPRMGTRMEYNKHPSDLGVMRKPGGGSPIVASGANSPNQPAGMVPMGICPGSFNGAVNNNNTISSNGQGGNIYQVIGGPTLAGLKSQNIYSTAGPCINSPSSNHPPFAPSVTSTMSSASCRGGPMNSAEFASHTNTTSSSATSTGDKETWTTTSAYNTGGESCRSTPLTLELNPAEPEYAEVGLSSSMLCLATPTAPNGSSSNMASDTEKQTQTPTKSREYSSEDSGHGQHKKGSSSSHTLKAMSISESVKAGLSQPGESLQDLYLRCADVMYTNRANLEHTIAVQQKLFQQQLDQQSKIRGQNTNSPGHSTGSGNEIVADGAKNSPGQTAPSDSGQMEWVVKRRPDGTRYITRRPVRSKMLKERAKKISEERCGMTTDDDAMSEMKTGRYWSKEDRKRHLEKARDYKKKKEILVKAKMETLKETEEKKEMNIVELSHRKMMKHKGKKVFDNFTTVKEMLAHGNKAADGKTYNPLLSVTTV